VIQLDFLSKLVKSVLLFIKALSHDVIDFKTFSAPKEDDGKADLWNSNFLMKCIQIRASCLSTVFKRLHFPNPF
jgi:hypothetical protein